MSNTLRSAKDGPFCWQSKTALRRIREAFGGTNRITSALATYNALTENASNLQSESFKAAAEYIGMLAGLHRNTVSELLNEFVELGLISKHVPPGIKQSAIISLLRFPNDARSECNDAPSGSIDAPPQGNVAQVEPGVLEHNRRIKEESTEENKDTRQAAVFDSLLSTKSDAFRAAWQEWMTHRNSLKPKLTPEQFSRQLEKLADWTESEVISAINNSIRNAWKGLFKPDGQRVEKKPERVDPVWQSL
jgi:hypothetical protein